MSEATTVPETKPVVQKYRQRAKQTFQTYDEATEYRDARLRFGTAEDKKDRTRIRRRADGTFDVVLYDEIKVVTP
jgi:hypothetical protein